jgi:hypothetical protein
MTTDERTLLVAVAKALMDDLDLPVKARQEVQMLLRKISEPARG